jgi:predicted ATPase with chaperone activity
MKPSPGAASSQIDLKIDPHVFTKTLFLRQVAQPRARAATAATPFVSASSAHASASSHAKASPTPCYLSSRAQGRKVARTIADLAATEAVTAAHVAEVVQYRRLEKP